MNSKLNKLLPVGLVSAGLCLAVMTTPAGSAPTDLANNPMANSTTTSILPNIMFDLDNSGSMSWDYMPDFVRFGSIDGSSNVFGKYCRGITATNTLIPCEPGDPPYYAAGFNSLYYNPDVRYSWPVTSTGARLADVNGVTAYTTPWANVASDGYGKQRVDNSAEQVPSILGANPCLPDAGTNNAALQCPLFARNATIDLLTGYPERKWCSDLLLTDCKSGLETNAYKYPDGTYNKLKVVRGAPYYYRVDVEWCSTKDTTTLNNNFGPGGATCQAKRTAVFKNIRYFNWSRVDILPNFNYPKTAGRTDCAGEDFCTYTEEMNNFANWYGWYRTRMNMTKSSIGLAFEDVRGTPKTGADLIADPADPTFLHARVGLTTLNNPLVVNIAPFNATQRETFYTSLYNAVPDGGTPLRTALTSLGTMYAGTSTVYSDPVEYSCQKNFAILATDGYWNDPSFTLADQDGVAGVTRPSLDASKAANTLADVAYYYYHTDLRTNCPAGSTDKCTNNVPPSGTDNDYDDVAQHQHMTTFTVSLGIDGTLNYDEDYKTSGTGDYYAIAQGSMNWPVPVANSQTTIDDLWHAAVNGRGTYFSTKDPAALEKGLKRALNSIERVTGSGAAAATSNLQPTSGDNFIYIATYRTVKWDGEVSAYAIDLGNGSISTNPVWTAEELLKAKITAAGNVDTRTIYTSNGSTRTLFKAGTGGLTDAQLALFDNTKLSQYESWSDAQRDAATPALMVNALRGHDRFEDQNRPEEYGNYQRLYRDRDKVLGDIIHAQPIYVKAPPHSFVDDGYAAFKTANVARAATLYAASNDGMLHAFDGATGQERWAYVPPVIMPEMYRLIDANYENNHRFFLDGPVTISDAKIDGVWKTVLIGGLGKGGRGYYALDITDPANPLPLWNFTAAENANVGYSFGTPFIAKMADGAWVAVVTSGYNNVPEGSNYAGGTGRGYVFVLNLATGAVIRTIDTGVGSTDTPSGLARMNLLVRDFDVNATIVGGYAGDLAGNMWRFDLEAGTATKVVAFGANKPIMVAPEIADVDGRTAIYFGTGRYLGTSDLSNVSVQSIYGIKDDGATTLTDTSTLVQQSVTTSNATRSITNNTVDWSIKNGWFVNLPDNGERVTIDPQVYFGTLVFASTVPDATACQPGGYSWLYQLSYLTGGNAKSTVAGGTRFTSPIVGLTVSKLPTGTPVIYPITADGKKPIPRELQLPPPSVTTGTKRVLWRELFN